ncbi:MAG TPA: HAMP domain-containing sensor histidine kinase, partial [Synergistaceae bacterium]|nr:HAMP domain-containing sensor histidine kinase [Synergistaceae bacterium]
MKFRGLFFRKDGVSFSKNSGISLFYVLLVLVPGVVLGLLALSSFEKEESLLEKRFRETLGAELQLLSRQVLSFLEQTEKELYQELQELPPREEERFFSRWRQENPLVDIPFLLDNRLALVFPLPADQGEPRVQAFASWGESFFEGASAPVEIERILLAWKEAFSLLGESPPESVPPSARSSSGTEPPLPTAPPSPSLQPQEMKASQNPPSPASFSMAQLSRKASVQRNLSEEEELSPSAEIPAEEELGISEQEKKPGASQEGSSPFFRKPRAFPEQIRGKSFGLLPYMMDNRVIFLFWARRGENIGGCLLREDLLKEKMGEVLLNNHPPRKESYSLAVLDEHGGQIYPPGNEEIFPESQPYESREIAPLLPYWRCAAFLAPSHSMFAQVERSRLRHLLIIGSLLFSLSGGSFLLFRALRLEMRTAEQKTTFVAKVSHELKTPLTSIRLFAEMLEEDRVPGEEKRRRYLRLMVSEIERLTRLIENILAFSRRERGLKRYSLKETDLYPLVSNIVESQRPRLEQQGFSLIFRGEGPLTALADEEGIAQILLNLLTNAEKYS